MTEAEAILAEIRASGPSIASGLHASALDPAECGGPVGAAPDLDALDSAPVERLADRDEPGASWGLVARRRENRP